MPMRYGCSFRNVQPHPEDVFVPSFVSSQRKDVIRAVYDENGKKVGTEKVSVPIVVAIDHSEFENLGLNCDLFAVENQDSDLFSKKPITTPFFGMTIDERGNAESYLDNFDFDSLVEKPQQDGTINFEK